MKSIRKAISKALEESKLGTASKSGIGKPQSKQITIEDVDEDSDASFGNLECNDYQWSGVISFNNGPVQEPLVKTANFSKEYFHTECSKSKGRPLKHWSFIFSPDDFDQEISLEQFQPQHLPVKDMQRYGQMATVIRQTLLERATEHEKLLIS